jgi:hypothetical protein
MIYRLNIMSNMLLEKDIDETNTSFMIQYHRDYQLKKY